MTSARDLDALLRYVATESRVCPKPTEWDAVWKMLPGCPEFAGTSEPWPPLILGGWWASTDVEKSERLAYHIRWAYDHDAFEAVANFLRGLPTKSWHHSDPEMPSF